MTPKIPDICKPDSTITLGYSGGMALYVAHWNSYLLLFEPPPGPRIIAGLTGFFNTSLN